MTLGSGILWSTILVLLAVTIYLVSVRNKWKTVAKLFGVLILGAAFIGGATWGWYAYQNRPQVVTELGGIRLGMTQLDVKLLKGAPTTASEIEEQKDHSEDDEGKKGQRFKLSWLFGGDESSGTSLKIVFYGATRDDLRVAIVCETGGYSTPLGLGRFSSEEDIVKRLGSPSTESIDSQGLRKVISYRQWKTAYEIEKGSVEAVCVAASGRVRYSDEYKDAGTDARQ
jgi:hypothetical protein